MNGSNTKIVITCALVAFTSTFLGNAINVAIPTITSSMNLQQGEAGHIISAYTISLTFFIIPCGLIADRIGLKKVHVPGVIGFALISLLCINCKQISALVILQAIQGFFAAMMQGTNTAICVKCHSQSLRGKIIGILVSFNYLGLAMGALIGGMLVKGFGWNSIFTCSAALTLMAGFLSYSWVPLKSEGSETNDSDNRIHVIRELTSNHIFISRILSMLLFYAGTFAISYLLSLFFQDVKGLTASQLGGILLVLPCVECIVSPFAGRISDKYKCNRVASIGSMACIIALLCIGLMISFIDVFIIIMIMMIVCGIGTATFVTANTHYVYDSIPNRYYGAAASLVGISRSLGQSVAMLIANNMIQARNDFALVNKISVLLVIYAGIILIPIIILSLSKESEV